ncbi:hypothetical protein ABIE52_003701 [Rhodococcus sp. OAS809]|uniref:hypothetical protein n=1 Tax=Rhodococcus sp. OAS809 TaxID=2663874 RepID=UPI001789BF65
MSGVTGVDVEHTKALEAAATDGGWAIWRDLDDGFYVVGEESGVIPEGADHVDGEHNPVAHVYVATNAAIIAHARTTVPALVAAVERVQAQQARIAELLGVVLPHTAVNDKTRVALMQLFQIHDDIKALETP